MDAAGRTLGLRLFLEGVEVDVSQATVTCGVNRPAMAQIVIPMVKSVHELLPRTLVHLFYLEGSFTQAPGSGVGKNKPVDKNDLTAWKLLFVGEATGYSYSKVAGMRQIELTCQDFTTYWQAMKLYWGKRKTSLQSYKQSVYMGASQLRRGGKSIDNSTGLLGILLSKPSTLPALPGLLGGLVALLESAVGVYEDGNEKKFRGANDFLSQAELRLHLTRMLGVSEADTSSAAFFSANSFKRFLSRLSKEQRSTLSYMDLLDTLLSKIYHVRASIAAPPYFRNGDKVKTMVVEPTGERVNSASDVGSTVAKLRAMTRWLGDVFDQKNRRSRVARLPPKYADDFVLWRPLSEATSVNVCESDSYKEYTDWDHKTDTELHLQFRSMLDTTGLGANMSKKGTPYSDLGAKVSKEMRDKGSGSGQKRQTIIKAFETVQEAFDLANKCAGSIDIEPLAGSGVNWNTLIIWNRIFRLCEEAYTTLAKGIGIPTRMVPKTFELRDRLYATMIHPDIYMVPPPRCNVVFPDQAMSIRFGRSWLTEVTRLTLFGRTESGRDKKDSYFSPNAEMLAGPTGKDTAKAAATSSSFLMRHEKFTGIVPSILGLGDNDIYKKIHAKTIKDAKKAATADGATPYNEGDYEGEAKYSKMPHMQRAANYAFFASRYGGRGLAVTMRFNPAMIPGFPALILDPSREGSQKDEKVTDSGTHFVGMVEELTHVLDATGGGQTVAHMSKSRAVSEDTSMYARDGDDSVTSKTESTTTRVELKLASGGYFWFKSNKYLKHKSSWAVSDKLSALEWQDIIGSAYDPKATYEISIVRENGVVVTKSDFPTGATNQELDDYSVGTSVDDVLAPLGMSNPESAANRSSAQVAIRVFKLTHGSKQRDVKFNFEATLYPPWISGIYYPSRIGNDYYRVMAGCGSILDAGDGLAPTGQISNTGELVTITTLPVAGGMWAPEAQIPKDMLTEDNAGVSGSTSIEDAAEKLATLWLALKHVEGDVDGFIDRYNSRAYANIEDVFGDPFTTDSEVLFSSDSAIGGSSFLSSAQKEGFHAQAFGDKDGLRGLQTEPLSKLSDPSGKLAGTDPGVDPRKERRKRVMDYVYELRKLRDRS